LVNFVDTLDPEAVENQLVTSFQTGVTSLFATLDGRALEHLQSDLVRTDFFSAGPTLPGSWVDDNGADVGTELTPTKGVGYWIVINRLSKGDHTLEYGGVSTSPDATIHTTATIHVA
jgi:hypothetical protein